VLPAAAREASGAHARRISAARGTVRFFALLTVVGAGLSPPLANAAAAMMLVSFLCVPQAAARLGRALQSPLGLGWLALVAALLLSAAWAWWRGVPPRDVLVALNGWRHLLLVPVGLAVFDEAVHKRRFALGFIVFAVVGAVASMLALGADFTKTPGFPGVVLRNPVTQALVFATGFYLSVLLLATGEAAGQRMRVAVGVSAALLLALLLVQTGRSGVLALVVASLITVLLQLRGRVRWAALAAVPLLAAAMVVLSPTLQHRYAMGLQEMRHAAQMPRYSSMGIRTVIWETSLEIVAEAPVLGHGLGSYPAVYRARIGEKYPAGSGAAADWRSLPTVDPHNQYLFLWIEAGAAGLVGFALLLLGAWRQPAGPPYRAAGAALLGAWCATSLFSSHFQAFNEGHLIAVFLGVFLAVDRGRALQPVAQGRPSLAATAVHTSS
jgi:O-antigen ligase